MLAARTVDHDDEQVMQHGVTSLIIGAVHGGAADVTRPVVVSGPLAQAMLERRVSRSLGEHEQRLVAAL